MPSFFDPSRLEQESILRALTKAQIYFNGLLLDIGCGSQPYATLVKKNNVRYIGIDFSPEYNPPPDVCADSLRLPFQSDSFDTVLTTQVLEHIPDPFKMFYEMSRVLKAGGHVVLTAPQVWPLHEEPRDYFRYTRYGLELLARQNNFEIIYLKERSGGVIALGQMTGAMLFDKIDRQSIMRVPVKILVAIWYAIVRSVDKFFYYPKLTLGYVMIARKLK